MKSASERTLPSAARRSPDTSSRTGAATSTVTRTVLSGRLEPGVIAVMPGERPEVLCRSLTFAGYFRGRAGPGRAGAGPGTAGPVGGPVGSALVAGVVPCGALVAELVGARPARHHQLRVARLHLHQELLGAATLRVPAARPRCVMTTASPCLSYVNPCGFGMTRSLPGRAPGGQRIMRWPGGRMGWWGGGSAGLSAQWPGVRACSPVTRRGRPSGLASRSSAGNRASGTDW